MPCWYMKGKIEIICTKCQSLLSGFLLSLKMNEASLLTLQKEIAELEQLLADKKHQLKEAQTILAKQTANSTTTPKPINNYSPPEAKITLFRSLFKGREDVYAKRFESAKTGKSGYQPVCRNEWIRGVCKKPKAACGSCTQRSFEPVTDGVIKNHLAGLIVMGVYPLLQNETCHFLAVDFDKEAWREDFISFFKYSEFFYILSRK